MNNHAKRFYDFGPFRLDPKERLLLRDGEPIPLTPKVFDTLLALVENSGQLVEKDELLQRVWPDAVVEEHGLAQNIFLLRKVFGEASEGQQYIETVSKRGYRFVAAVKETRDGEPELILQKRTRLRATVEQELDKDEPEGERRTTHLQLERQAWWMPSILQRKRTIVAISIAVAIGVVVGGLWWVRQHQRQPKLAFQERDWVLITSFENRTGDPLFHGTIEYAIERELSNSLFVNVTPPERIGDALVLMKKPPDTKVDLAIGREICLRDGGIRALLAGRAEKVGSTYQFSVSLIDPGQGSSVDNHSEEASGQEGVSPAVRRLSNWVRQVLGESIASIQRGDRELEKVTTPSFRALQVYSQADAIGRQGNWKVAEQLLRQALVEDPEFASAHILLAWSLKNQNKPEDEWKSPSDRALELAERVSERERYFIQGSYYSIRRQDDKAAAVYEALLQRYPDHYWGRNNLAVAYSSRLYRFRDALPHTMYLADLRPNDLNLQISAASTAALCHSRDESLRYARRANELITPEATGRNPGGVSRIQFFLINEPRARGDLETTLTALDRFAQTVDARNGGERDAYSRYTAFGYLLFGKLQTAEEFARKVTQGEPYFILAIIALIKDDKDGLKKSLLGHLRTEGKNSVVALPLLIRARLFAEAQKLISTTTWKDEGFLKGYQGMIALTEGQSAQAIPLLEQGIKSAHSSCLWECFYACSESLAAAYELQGDLRASLRALEEGCREDEAENGYGMAAMVFWLKIKARLAELYRKLGRLEDAQRVEAELLRLLAYADADHPILRQLKTPQASNQSQNKR